MPTFKRAAAAAFLVIALPVFAAAALAQPAKSIDNTAKKPMAGKEYQLGDLVIRQPWTRATPKGAPVAGGYVTIENRGKSADRLVDGSFALAGRFEIHEMAVIDGVMRMRHLPKGLEIKPGQTLVLKPGSYHLMFMKLKGRIVPGKPEKGTLVFEKAGRIEVEFAAAPIGAKTMSGHGGHMKH